MMNKYKDRISDILVENMKRIIPMHYVHNALDHEPFLFYADRLFHVYNYGLFQGREIIKMICRTAFNDSALTEREAIVIMETCLDSRLDNILMEVNYNEGW